MKVTTEKFEKLDVLLIKLMADKILYWSDEHHISRPLSLFESIFYSKYCDVRDDFCFKLVEDKTLTYENRLFILAQNVSGFMYKFPLS
jgi:hypothetical protein